MGLTYTKRSFVAHPSVLYFYLLNQSTATLGKSWPPSRDTRSAQGAVLRQAALARRPNRSQSDRSNSRPAQAALAAPRAAEPREPALPRPAPPRTDGTAPRGPGRSVGWVVWSRAVPSHAVHSGEARHSLAMSAAEAGGVFHRARGRTLDAFSAGTACPVTWGGNDCRAAEPFSWGTCSPGVRASSRTGFGAALGGWGLQ